MGTVELLSREGEIAIAKRIEAGREAMIAGLCESPLTFQAIIIWRDELNEGKIFLRDIIDLEATYAGPDAKNNMNPAMIGAVGPDGQPVASPNGNGMAAAVAPATPVGREKADTSAAAKRNRIPFLAGAALLVLFAGGLVGLLVGQRTARPPVPTFRELSFRRGALQAARFAPDPRSAVYSAAWEGTPEAVFISSANSTESRDLTLPETEVLAVSAGGQLAVLRRFGVSPNHFTHRGRLAEVSIGADAPRDLLDNVEAADWAPGGDALAVVHVVSGQSRVEYPIGKVLYQTVGWISNLRFSPKGDRLAFIDHNLLGDDGGTISVVDLNGKKSDLTERWASAFGLAWAPSGDEIWFTATATGFSRSLRGVSLSGKLRELLSAPGTLTLHDVGIGGRALISRDAMRSWNRPTIVWRGYAGSLLSFLQLHDGRIVVPFCYLTRRSWASRGEGFDKFTFMGEFSSSVAYSDDGETWHTSPNELKEPTPQIGNDGGIEPCVLELKSGRLWMLIRTQNGRFFESFSEDRGVTWTHPVPTNITSSDSPCSMTRLRDGRVVMLWNNTLRYPYANGGRAVLHGAISEDDGKTWRGYREVAANPYAVEPPPPNGDHGVTYTVPALTASGKLLTSLSTGHNRDTLILRLDPEWLYETKQQDDFSRGLKGWTSFGTRGVALEAHPENSNRQVLGLRKPDPEWPAGAVWNFPAGKRGELRMRVRLAPNFAGALVGLTDHFSVAFDEQDRFCNVFNLDIGPGGKLAEGVQVPTGRWADLVFSWDCDLQRQCSVTMNGRWAATEEPERLGPFPRLLAGRWDLSRDGGRLP
jgi:hypothetical protein